MTEQKRVLAVLGMHRSGTSCLAGSLEDAGVFLGDVSRKNPFNLKGNNENSRIMDLHQAVLKDNGGEWDSPPATATWAEPRKTELRDIIASYDAYPIWAFKDPRALLLLDAWLEAIPGIDLIGIFRHPLHVARSLHSRSGMALEKGVSLWIAYNAKLIETHRRFGFPVINFDLEEPAFKRQLVAALGRIGLKAEESRLRFFDNALRHHQDAGAPGIPLPAEAARMYEALVSIAK